MFLLRSLWACGCFLSCCRCRITVIAWKTFPSMMTCDLELELLRSALVFFIIKTWFCIWVGWFERLRRIDIVSNKDSQRLPACTRNMITILRTHLIWLCFSRPGFTSPDYFRPTARLVCPVCIYFSYVSCGSRFFNPTTDSTRNRPLSLIHI